MAHARRSATHYCRQAFAKAIKYFRRGIRALQGIAHALFSFASGSIGFRQLAPLRSRTDSPHTRSHRAVQRDAFASFGA
jgi:hypothetical protein